MSTGGDFKRGLAKVRRERQASKFDQALATVDRLLQDWPDHPRLLVLRAELIQLLDTPNGPSLEEAKEALQRAVAVDEESPAALIELGHFLFAVEDDAEAAAKCFDKAAVLCKRLLSEAFIGWGRALAELGKEKEAWACLAQAYSIHLHGDKPKAGRDANGAEILKELEHWRRAE